MLNRHALIVTLTFALAGPALTACGGQGTTPNLAPQPQGAPLSISNTASMPNLRGEFAGTVDDSLFGSGQIYGDLVQYHNAVGGNFTFTYGSTEFGTPHVFLLNGAKLSGAGESATLALDPCTVSETATHSNHGLTGSYKAVSGCSGDNGTFTMNESCRYGTSSFELAGPGLKACGASASLIRAPQAQVAGPLISDDPNVPNLSGEFVGSVNDSLYGSGQTYAELVQYHDAVGGIIIFEYGSTVFVTPDVFLLSKGTTLTGTGESATLSGDPCAISETAMQSNLRLKGSYKARRGCSGENGTFTMKEVCRYVANSVAEPRAALKNCYTF